jgi:hypothetical protein
MFKSIEIFITALLNELYVIVGILLKWALTTSLTPPKPGKWSVMYLCARGIDFASIYDCSINLWNCSDSAISGFVFYYRFFIALCE